MLSKKTTANAVRGLPMAVMSSSEPPYEVITNRNEVFTTRDTPKVPPPEAPPRAGLARGSAPQMRQRTGAREGRGCGEREGEKERGREREGGRERWRE